MRYYDNIIIGAGQSGLAIAYYLHKDHLDFIIFEKESIASSWRKHYDSLKLITPNPFISLSGKKFKSSNKFPSKNEVINYLTNYAKDFKHRIKLNTAVVKINKEDDNYVLETSKGTIYKCKNLIIASGYNGESFTPEMSKNLNNNVIQYHSSEYKSLDSFPDQKQNIAVIGSGNSGISIVQELSSKHNVSLFQGKVKRFPRKILGIDIFWWVNTLGLFRIKRGTILGDKLAKKLIPQGDPTYGLYPEKIAKEYGFNLFERLASCNGNKLTDSVGKSIDVDGVVWATGYRTNYHKFLPFKIFDNTNQVQHFRGVTSYRGLYFLGLKWQSNISSFLIFGVKNDAKYIYKKIKKNYLIPSSFGVKKKLNGERLLKGIKKLSVKNLSNLQK